MKLTIQLKLLPTPEQRRALLETIETINAACNWVSRVAFETKTFRRVPLHRAVYQEIRDRFSLPAQLAVHAITKVVNAYKRDRKKERVFKKHGAVIYDDRVLRYFPDRKLVSITLLSGREKIPFTCGERQRELLKHRQGESFLAYVRGEFYLLAIADVEEPEPIDVEGVLGVDLGLANLATDSEGERFSGKALIEKRKRFLDLRRRLQKKGTRSARRHLKKLSRKERNFTKTLNHTIAKRLVEKARKAQAVLVLEDLKGIRQRTTVRRERRHLHETWPYHQLRSFVLYKAEGFAERSGDKACLSGVPVVFVDPAHTSQTCPFCGCVDKRNRKSQSSFECVRCGFFASGKALRDDADHADRVAAVNIAARAAVNRPIVGWHGASSHVATAS